MIDEKKLVKNLENEWEELCDYSENVEILLEYVTKFIEEQPKIGGWIPCSERLPEENGYYMVTKKIKETGKRFTGKSRFDTEKGWNDPLNFVDIVAWQPLPEEYHG
ncbi:MAG: DUF551 domain-containing protein [Lachnospiraceae bacterium]|nr:DUF551 domain-containing protein [Lachnospiraceae bacterium]